MTVSFVFDNVTAPPLCGSGEASDDTLTDTDDTPGGCTAGSSVTVHEFAAVAAPCTVVWVAAPALVMPQRGPTTHIAMTLTPIRHRRVPAERRDGPLAILNPPLDAFAAHSDTRSRTPRLRACEALDKASDGFVAVDTHSPREVDETLDLVRMPFDHALKASSCRATYGWMFTVFALTASGYGCFTVV